MGLIQKLPDQLINQIAAGEVIERPASVVKELVENAIDAGATRIEITIEGGGQKKISVKDNGAGMPPEDAALSIVRHATSKIKDAADLFKILTMGFRGEALASISAVSKMTLETKMNQPGILEGTRLKIVNEEIKNQETAGLPGGTTVTVEELFFNLPARLKFLKKDLTELSYISSQVQKFILAHPEISFSLTYHEKKVLSYEATAKPTLKNSIGEILGREVEKKLLPVEMKTSEIEVTGFVADPTLTRATREDQYFFINRRAITSPTLLKAVSEAYRTFIPNGRHGIVVLHMQLHPAQVDVNVHPAKKEVRFKEETQVFQVVKSAIRQAIMNGGASPQFYNPIQAPQPPEGGAMFFPPFQGRVGEGPKEIFSRGSSLTERSRSEQLPIMHSVDSTPALTLPRAIMQIYLTYILTEHDGQILLIDQHVAQERVLFDELKANYAQKAKILSQPLLVPEIMELSASEVSVYKEFQNYFTDLGYEIEMAGERAVRVLAVPLTLMKADQTKLIKDILSEIQIEARSEQMEQKIDKVLAMVACKASIKAGMPLDLREMQAAVNALFQTQNPYTCPHGRPIVLPLEKMDLDKRFLRI
jgi:DNA mismatch repair protein MutL